MFEPTTSLLITAAKMNVKWYFVLSVTSWRACCGRRVKWTSWWEGNTERFLSVSERSTVNDAMRFSAPVQTGAGVHPASSAVRYHLSFPHPSPTLKSGAISLLPSRALSASYMVNFALWTTLWGYSKQNKCLWRGYNAVLMLRSEPSSYHTLPTTTVYSVKELN
jgi:hypothetical protein